MDMIIDLGPRLRYVKYSQELFKLDTILIFFYAIKFPQVLALRHHLIVIYFIVILRVFNLHYL